MPAPANQTLGRFSAGSNAAKIATTRKVAPNRLVADDSISYLMI
jgi:hypothetical protein